MKEKIEKQLEFARQRQEQAKYLEEREWRGYIQGLIFVLGLLEQDKYDRHGS